MCVEFLEQSDPSNCGPVVCLKIMELFHSTKCQGREACICFKSYLLNGHGGMEEYGHTLLKKFTEGREISCFCCDDTPQLDIILLMPCCNQKTHKTCVLTWLKSNRPYCRKVVNILPPKWWYCCPHTCLQSCKKSTNYPPPLPPVFGWSLFEGSSISGHLRLCVCVF